MAMAVRRKSKTPPTMANMQLQPQHHHHDDLNHNAAPASSSSSSSSSSPEKWHRFAEWMHCVCVVTFDLELGQAMEAIYPPHVHLCEQETMNICYLAFPDSNSGCMGDTQYHIRLRVAPATAATMLCVEHQRFNATCAPVQRADAGHYWGFVYFRQIKDDRLPRGYFQKSLVLLTRLPFIRLYHELCALIAPLYFDGGATVLESVCDNIDHWPALMAGETLRLPVLGRLYRTAVPKANSKTNATLMVDNANIGGGGGGGGELVTTEEMDPMVATVQPHLLSSVHEIDIFDSLVCVLPHVHLLWELVLTAEPIVVMATSPTDCSAMVASLVALIAPLSYCAEFRPYFTIHDSEFKEFTQQRAAGPPPIILGVTNPFFAKTLQHWPHTVRLHDHGGLPVTTVTSGGGGTTMPIGTATRMAGGSGGTGGGGGSQKLRKIRSMTGAAVGRLLDVQPGVYTQYRQYLHKDASVLRKIQCGMKTARPSSIQSALLRRHLLELTQSFMIPLERYMASLMPLQRDISPFKAAPMPHQFKQDDFLATLDVSGPQLTSTFRGDWVGLYKRFFRTPNFKGWYESRYAELQQTLQALQLQALSEADMKNWVEGRHEVEIVDMILKLKQKLKICNVAAQQSAAVQPLRPETKLQLLQHLDELRQRLPDDLQTILNQGDRAANIAAAATDGFST